MNINTYLKSRNVIYDLDLKSDIYKYIPLKYVLPIYQNGKIRFDPTKNWEDVYENFFFQEQFIGSMGEADAKHLINGLYGQSWTLLEESDAMWRIYSKFDYDLKDVTTANVDEYKESILNLAVRIKTKAQKLYDSIYLSDEDCDRAYIGRVVYLEERDINSLFDYPINIRDLNDALVKTMFMKRTPFSHENEVRPILIYSPDQTEFFNKPYLEFNLVASDFIEEIVIDPRVNDEVFNYIKNSLVEKGVDSNIIKKSELYKFTRVTVRLE